jgi:hypothetical protein
MGPHALVVDVAPRAWRLPAGCVLAPRVAPAAARRPPRAPGQLQALAQGWLALPAAGRPPRVGQKQVLL